MRSGPPGGSCCTPEKRLKIHDRKLLRDLCAGTPREGPMRWADFKIPGEREYPAIAQRWHGVCGQFTLLSLPK